MLELKTSVQSQESEKKRGKRLSRRSSTSFRNFSDDKLDYKSDDFVTCKMDESLRTKSKITDG